MKDEREKCEECGKPFAVGDRVTMTTRYGSVRYRYWHPECFNGSLTPISEWPKDLRKPNKRKRSLREMVEDNMHKPVSDFPKPPQR